MTIDPQDPVVVVVDPRTPVDIEIAPATEIIDATSGSGGQVTVTEGSVTFTPEPGTSGRQEITITYLNRAGVQEKATVVVNVRPKAATSALPTTLRLGANSFAVDERAQVAVTCRPLMRAKSAGDVRLCSTSSAGGRAIVRINAPATVTVTVTAATADGGTALLETRTYAVRR